MKLSRAAARRTFGLVAAALIGAAAAIAVAAPASAHHPIVKGDATCDAETGTWKVTWKVANSENDLEGTLTKVSLSPSGSTVTNIVVGAKLPVSGAAPLVGTQVLPATATSAKLEVTAKWQRSYRDVVQSASYSVSFSGTCSIPTSPKPAATFASHCDGSVTVTLLNGKDATAAASFVVTGTGGFAKNATVKPDESVDVAVPAANAATVTAKVGQKIIATNTFEDPAECATPEKTVAQTCDSISFTVTNPDGGRVVTGKLTPSTGDAVAFSLLPGESKDASFPAADGLTVALTATGLDDETVAWAKPASCAPPPLPDTGASLTTTIVSGAALVIAGIGILFFFRRRSSAHARY